MKAPKTSVGRFLKDTVRPIDFERLLSEARKELLDGAITFADGSVMHWQCTVEAITLATELLGAVMEDEERFNRYWKK